MKKVGFIFFLLLGIAACGNVQEKMLIGQWQAAAVLEDGMPMPISPSDIGFEFSPNGQYSFRSTLLYREAGSFSVDGNLLFTLDTINEASTEKSVQIMQVTPDSLFLKMNAEGKEQIIKLFKINPAVKAN